MGDWGGQQDGGYQHGGGGGGGGGWGGGGGGGCCINCSGRNSGNGGVAGYAVRLNGGSVSWQGGYSVTQVKGLVQ